jgi:hypothetical protein
MSKANKNKNRGHPMMSFRCPAEIQAAVKAYVRGADERRRDGGISVNAFLVQAVVEKLAHIERSKKNRKRKTPGEKMADAALAFLA